MDIMSLYIRLRAIFLEDLTTSWMSLQVFLNSDVSLHLLDHSSSHLTRLERQRVQDKSVSCRLGFMVSTYGVNPRGMNYDILDTVIHYDLSSDASVYNLSSARVGCQGPIETIISG